MEIRCICKYLGLKEQIVLCIYYVAWHNARVTMYVRQLVSPFCKLGNGGSKIIYIIENVSVTKKIVSQ